jgi:hypothetical protein
MEIEGDVMWIRRISQEVTEETEELCALSILGSSQVESQANDRLANPSN